MAQYDIDTSKTFVNPYNFVRVDLKNKPVKDIAEQQGERTLTGWIDYTVHTKTPLAIPDTENVWEEKVARTVGRKQETEIHKHYRFMRNTAGEYIIPGSSVRGVVRNVYEVATDSCFSTLKDDQRITARQGGMA